jgi:hypothetical protein
LIVQVFLNSLYIFSNCQETDFSFLVFSKLDEFAIYSC